MGRCEDFYIKWIEEPNWCHKCPSSVFTIEKYLEMVKKLDAAGVKFAYANLTENQVRMIPKKQMDLYVPEIVNLVLSFPNFPKRKITDEELKEIHKKIQTKSTDYNELESPPREIKKRWVICPECGHGFSLEKAKKVSRSKIPEITEKEHDRRKARVCRALDLDSELVDLYSEWDKTLSENENFENLKRKHGISKEPDLDKINQETKEFYEKDPSDEEIEAKSQPPEIITDF